MPQQPIEFATPVVVSKLRTIMRPTVRILACAIGLLVGASAIAGDYTTRDIGDWIVAPSEDGQGCFLTKVYEHLGDTTLLFGLDPDGKNRLSVLNANWSIKPKDQLSLDFRLSKGSYAKHFAIGMASDGKQGFVTSFEAKFSAYFAASKMLDIFRGDVPVERLSLDGSGAAVAELRKCVAARRERPVAADGKVRSDDIPEDPFALGSAQNPKN